MGLMMFSIFSLNYGQYYFSWESSFFDSYMSNRISAYSYIKSKDLFFSIGCLLGFIITLPYAIISYKVAFINAAFLLYNIGISSVIILFFCTFNTSYIDLGKSQFFNYQGAGIMQFLVVIPIMAFPFIIYSIFNIMSILQYYYTAIAIMGLLGIIFNRYLLQLIVIRFVKRKYKMALGFRQK